MDSVSLSDIAVVRSGFPFRGKVEVVASGGVFVVQPKDIIEGGTLDVGGIVRSKISNVKTDYVLHAGDTLLAARGRIAAANYLGQPSGVCVASGSLLVLRSKSTDQLIPGYLTVFFNSDYGQSCLTRIVSQTTATFVSRSDLMYLKVPLPDLELQMRLITMARSTARYASLTRRRTALMNSLVSHHTHV
jgi:restriction endonuclease S subunit